MKTRLIIHPIKIWMVFSALVIGALLATACGAQSPSTVGSALTQAANQPNQSQTTQSTQTFQGRRTRTPGANATPTATQTAPAPAASPTSTATPTPAPRTADQAALDAAKGVQPGGSVSLLGPWSGTDQDSFLAMLKPFEDATGIKVAYQSAQDVAAQLAALPKGGTLPDLAFLADPSQVARLAQAGSLQDLSRFIDANTLKNQYAQTWIDLGTVGGKWVGLVVKAAPHGVIWYDPQVWKSAGYSLPSTLNDLITLSAKIVDDGNAPWCVALESGKTSGWPGASWLGSILLNQAGADFYGNWQQGKEAWISPEVVSAWQTLGMILTTQKMVYGGVSAALSTSYDKVGDPLFTSPPGCFMAYQGFSITSNFTKVNPALKPGQDFDFFPLPPTLAGKLGSLVVDGVLAGVLTDTPQAEALIRYLAAPEAQSIWAKLGGYLSPNKLVKPGVYPDPISQKAAGILAGAQTAVFAAEDQMPLGIRDAFFRGILTYIRFPEISEHYPGKPGAAPQGSVCHPVMNYLSRRCKEAAAQLYRLSSDPMIPPSPRGLVCLGLRIQIDTLTIGVECVNILAISPRWRRNPTDSPGGHQ